MDVALSSTNLLHYPSVEDVISPKMGMHFDDLNDEFEFYNGYAKHAGFRVRKVSTRTKNGEVVWKRFRCSKEGKTNEKYWIDKEFVQRRRMEMRENCNAMLQVKKEQSGGFVVSKFVPEHSHALTTPHKRFLLRSHREVPESKKQLIKTFDSSNISSTHQMTVFNSLARGPENLGFIDKDVENVRRKNREEKKGLDGQLLFEQFKNRKEMSSGFIYNIERDRENKITHLFWADHNFRTSYGIFGDVVTFDTTYKTNCYGLIFSTFVGCNHHGQTTLFCCAFLPNEKFESFEWLFTKWLEAMPSSPPNAILTDQELAMTKAIKKVMPNTHHRYCMWHILEKLPAKLGGVSIHNDGLIDDIKSCVRYSDTPADFDTKWRMIMEKSSVGENEWLVHLFDIREMWVPTYLKHILFRGMSTTSTSESMNAFVKQYVQYKNSLIDFIVCFEQGVARLRYLENKEDHESSNGRPKLKTCNPMEKQMADIYTRKIFYKFQDELFLTTSMTSILVNDDVASSIFIVRNLNLEDKIEREVVWKKEEQPVTCTCRKFEFEGIPCRHIVSVLRQLCITYLPEKYILKRWTQNVRKGTTVDKYGVGIGSYCADSFLARHGQLSSIFMALIDEASPSKECFEYMVGFHTEMQAKIRQINPTFHQRQPYRMKKKQWRVMWLNMRSHREL